MTLLVIDASVVIKWFLMEPLAEAALRLLDVERTFLAPDHLFAETTNVVWKKVRRNEFSADYGRRVISEIGLTAVAITTISCRELARDAFNIAAVHGRSIYDAMYVALAMQRKTRLITADTRLYNALVKAPEIAPHIRSLADY
jgi:predicted nucleic acid-binding protein